ncbi:alpha/beta hydrolase [Leptolyngbya sp. NIES-2104]|uniref:alpha/beta hydrolase n=1 Tax=Leptolyngbya sp. NIES-2104 TaxID=1552121 RepID=UPI0006ECB47A|nr:alpha/beta hydrolase [Leptolyngbya sp. NIES-2104]GAP94260.1 hypothetical protein NIES2104_07710 [Leptolyngbya sp. NIES-2104]
MQYFTSRSLKRIALAFVGWLPIAFTMPTALSAERVKLSYSLFEQSIPIALLEPYIKTGKMTPELAAYVQQIDAKQLAQMRSFLSAKISLNAVAVSQFLYTPIGEQLLKRLEQVIQADGPTPGFYALRAGLIQAAADPQGFTPLDVLMQFPSRNVRVNLQQGLEIVEVAKQMGTQTEQAIAKIDQESRREADRLPTPSLDLRQPGTLQWRKQSLIVTARSRNHTIPTDLYLPISKTRHPVVVISHGLGSDRGSFAYLAQHLASHGFAVVVPEHSGSSSAQISALLTAKSAHLILPQELIDRPLDVKTLLDRLEQLSISNPNMGRLDLQNVGIIGQSLGGYTALATAGATIQPEHLRSICQTSQNSLNFSLLLQCLVLQVPQIPATVSDPRIKAVIAINPTVSGIFGQAGLSQIKVPTLFVTGSADTLAPALSEQIQPFTWLTTPHKYLALIEGGTHFSTIAASPSEVISLPASISGADPALARQYINVLSTAFLQTYLRHDQNYHDYLSSSYARSISRAPLKLKLVQTLGDRQNQSIVQLLNSSKRQYESLLIPSS